MNKLTIPIILSVIVLIAGVFAFMPVEKASTVHDFIIGQVGTFEVKSLEKTLPKNENSSGDDKTWTLTAVTDVVVIAIHHDNTPTRDALCTFDDHHGSETFLVHCDESGYRIVDMAIAGSEVKFSTTKNAQQERSLFFTRTFSDDNHLDLTEVPGFTDIPLKAGETIVMVFDTRNTDNDVRINVIFSVRGTATLT